MNQSLELARLKKTDKEALREVKDSAVAGPEVKPLIKYVGSKTFYLRKGVWYDSVHKEGMEEKKVIYLSSEYFTLLSEKPELGRYFALGKEVVVCLAGVTYRITEKG